jgi:hypothetical protein
MQQYNHTIYGDVYFETSYTDNELKEFILSYVKKEEFSTYNHLCRNLINDAVINNRLVGSDPEIFYQSPQLQPSEHIRVSKLLWDFILNGDIFINFHNNQFVFNSSH